MRNYREDYPTFYGLKRARRNEPSIVRHAGLQSAQQKLNYITIRTICQEFRDFAENLSLESYFEN